MKSETVQAFSKLVRLDYSLFGAFGIFLSGLLSGDLRSLQPEYLVGFLIAFLTAVGSFAFNDYYDFEVDKRNERKDRPLVSELLPRRIALLTGLASIFLTLLLSLLLNWAATSLVLLSFPLFYLYSLGLKRIVFAKNILVAYAYVSTILLGSIVSDVTVEPLISYFALMGLIVGTAFEIMLDMADVEGDQALGMGTLSTRFGVKKAAYASVFLYTIIMVMDPLPFFVQIDARLYADYVFLFLILVPVISYFFVSRSLAKDQSRNNVFKLKGRVFLTMQTGCIAYLVGVLL